MCKANRSLCRAVRHSPSDQDQNPNRTVKDNKCSGWQWSTLKGQNNQHHIYIWPLCLSASPSYSHTRPPSDTHTACICIYTKPDQKTKLLPHGYHSEGSKQRQNSPDLREIGTSGETQREATEWWENDERVGYKEEDTKNRQKQGGKLFFTLLGSNLYMRSMSISGSSWNSLIFTVSDKILFRFLISSSTCESKRKSRHTTKKQAMNQYEQCNQRSCWTVWSCAWFYTWEGSWVFCISVSSSA